MSNDGLNELRLPLDERNLAHVLSAVALAGLVSRNPDARPDESTCWWSEREFVVQTALDEAALFGAADDFIRTIRWVPGVGEKWHGTFVSGKELGSNPFMSLAERGQDSSPFKTFSAHQNPGDHLLQPQRDRLKPPNVGFRWLSQMETGISSWGFDCRIGSHAYDQGFSSNEDRSADLDPVYPAVELLSIAAMSFFTAVQGWQVDENRIRYSVWTRPVLLSLVSYAVVGRLEGIPARRYHVAKRGASYGSGGGYKFFPEATPESIEEKDNGRRKRKRP